ncbi:hypothetical protein EBR78_10635 [bacterium]|nr:hypothetical protein [bacterium]
MIQITFKNLERSELAQEAVQDRLHEALERFPDLSQAKLLVTLAMENSPRQTGPDLFRVKLRVSGGKYHGVILEKEASSLYAALADVNEHLLERLNRFGDKFRVKARTRERKLLISQ